MCVLKKNILTCNQASDTCCSCVLLVLLSYPFCHHPPSHHIHPKPEKTRSKIPVINIQQGNSLFLSR